MKEFVNNRYELKEEDIDITKEKVRALIINYHGEVTICNYGDIYILPGGKIEDDETKENALKRELKEELGLDFNDKEIVPFVTYIDYQKDYPTRSGETLNRKVTTHYYIINSNLKSNIVNQDLSKNEKEGFFKLHKIRVNQLHNVILYPNSNPRKDFFDKELLFIREEYSKLKDIDLHTHTTASDGELTKEELIEFAKKNNVGTLAICNHDNIDDFKGASYEENDSLVLIPGVEIGCEVKKGTLHIVGYDYDPTNKELNNFVDRVHKNHIYNMKINNEGIKQLFGFKVSDERIEELIKDDNIGRVYIAKELVSMKKAADIQDAFKKYLMKSHKYMKEDFKEVTAKEAINAIHSAGGFAVLAHPTSLKLNEQQLDSFVEELKSLGIDGIETYNQIFTEDAITTFENIAHKYDLYKTLGSDFHGKKVKPNVHIANGSYDRTKVKKLSIVEEIKRRHNSNKENS